MVTLATRRRLLDWALIVTLAALVLAVGSLAFGQAETDQEKTDTSYKKLVGRDPRSSGLAYYEDPAGGGVNVHGDEVWVDPIPADPVACVAAGTCFCYTAASKLSLTQDTAINNSQGWCALASGTSCAADPTQRRWIPPKYGAGYLVTLHETDGSDTQIPLTDEITWFWDYESGRLIIRDNPLSVTPGRCNGACTFPPKLTGCYYTGRVSTTGFGTLDHDPATGLTTATSLNRIYYANGFATSGTGTEASPYRGAVEAAVAAAVEDCGIRTPGAEYPSCVVELGPSVYECSNNCLGQWAVETGTVDHIVQGLTIRGAGNGGTIIRPLDANDDGVADDLNAAGDTYFFDNCPDETCALVDPAAAKPVMWSLSDIRFEGSPMSIQTSDDALIPRGVKGFRFAGNPVQQMQFHRVYFSHLNDVFVLKGDNQASEISLIDGGLWDSNGPLFRMDQGQSLNIVAVSFDVYQLFGDLIYVEDGGGAIPHWFGGFIGMAPPVCSNALCTANQDPCLCCTGSGTGDCPYTPTTERWVINSTQNAPLTDGNSRGGFDSVAFEFQGNYTGFAHVSGAVDPELGSDAQLRVSNSTIHAWNGYDGDRDLVRVGSYAHIHFDHCTFTHWGLTDEDANGYPDHWNIRFTADQMLARNGLVEITDSTFPLGECGTGGTCSGAPYPYRTMADRVFWEGAEEWGQFVSLRNRGQASGDVGIQDSVALDVRRGNPGMYETSSDTTSIRWPIGEWPRGGYEYSIWMPEDFMLTRIVGFQPDANGCGEATTGRYKVGTNDKATVYAASTNTQRQFEQHINVEDQRIVLSTYNQRRLRFWFDNPAAAQICTGGYLILEGK